MANLNTLAIMGRLTADPELKATSTGKKVVRFNIAVDGYGERADFFRVNAWDNTAEFISKYFRKGSMIAISGNLTTTTYQTEDGNDRTLVIINAQRAHFAGSKANDTPEAGKPENKPVEAEWTTPGNEDDLPF